MNPGKIPDPQTPPEWAEAVRRAADSMDDPETLASAHTFVDAYTKNPGGDQSLVDFVSALVTSGSPASLNMRSLFARRRNNVYRVLRDIFQKNRKKGRQFLQLIPPDLRAKLENMQTVEPADTSAFIESLLQRVRDLTGREPESVTAQEFLSGIGQDITGYHLQIAFLIRHVLQEAQPGSVEELIALIGQSSPETIARVVGTRLRVGRLLLSQHFGETTKPQRTHAAGSAEAAARSIDWDRALPQEGESGESAAASETQSFRARIRRAGQALVRWFRRFRKEQ